MSQIIRQSFPDDLSALAVDPMHPNRTLVHGLFLEKITVQGVQRSFLTYIPENLENCQPAIVIVPPSKEDPEEYLETSGLRSFADKHQVFMHLLMAQENGWNTAGIDSDYMNGVYAAILSRNYYIALQDCVYACGIGDGSVVAHQAAAKMTSEWSGLFSFGVLTESLTSATLAQAREQGLNELKIEAKKAPLPVWILADSTQPHTAGAIDYWKGENHAWGTSFSGQGADQIWMPCPVRTRSEVNEEQIAQVRVTNCNGQMTPARLEQVWDYIRMARRHRSFRKKDLRYYKDPEACGAGLQQMVFQGMNRIWYEYVPESCTPDKQWPLVLVFHGRGGTAQSFFDISGMSAVAEERKFIAVFPQAFVHQQKPGGLKNVLRWGGIFNDKPVDDVAFIRRMVAEIQNRYSVDPGRIYACGQSSGGIMADILGNCASDLFAACASWSGMYHPEKYFYKNEKTEPLTPTLFLCGINDAFCTEPGPDPEFPFHLNPELRKDIIQKLERYQLDPGNMQSWHCEPITWYCYPDKKGIPMLTIGMVDDMAHANYPEESWISYDQFLSQFWRDEKGRLIYRGLIV